MEKREIKFNAYLEIGDNKEISTIIEGVTVYENGDVGCSMDRFCNAVNNCGWSFDGEGFFKTDDRENYIDGGEFNVREGDEWVWFDGIPLQGTGLTDRKGNQVFEGSVVGQEGYLYQEIWFEDGAWLIGRKETSDRYFNQSVAEKVEQVGNIYQHPELLNPKPLIGANQE